MYKSKISILFAIPFLLFGIACAETPNFRSESLGRLAIETVIANDYPSELSDLQVAKKKMFAYQQDTQTMFPESDQYTCVADEEGNYLYTDNISDSITCLVNVDISSAIPDLDAELDFMGINNVEQYVIQFVEDHFGISAITYKTCALKRSTYEFLYEEARDILDADLAAGGKQGATDLIQWSSEDVCYIVFLFQSFDGIPFFARGETAVANMEVMPYCVNRTGIMAIVFEDGIRYLKIENAWDVSSSMEARKILTLDEAVSMYAQYINDIVALDELVVSDIRLVYGVKDGHASPLWSFEKEEITDSFHYTCHDFVDAYSGDIIGDGM